MSERIPVESGASALGSTRHAGRPRGRAYAPPSFPVVGIGASAGGLDACRKLVQALPEKHGMSFILVQHLDPSHESMMADLLASHTSMTVLQAADGMPIEQEHLYLIPPGTSLSILNRALHLSQPKARHGARLPFDFLLQSLAAEYREQAVCVVLSGTGADGSVGLKAIRANGGLVIAQDPHEAGYDSMPRSAIATGAVDLVLPAAKIGNALIKYSWTGRRSDVEESPRQPADDALPAIIQLLRTKTAHDFTLYKKGTLQRRIERRIAMMPIANGDIGQYLDILRRDSEEIDLLAKDLLINVTSFFRDPKVFASLAETIVPELVNDATQDRPLRIWIAGCSTGEETYSLAMLFQEEIAARKRAIKLQVFASDVDPDAVALAREGLYASSIEAAVSSERLARFFLKEDRGYRVSPELRNVVVFAVQDLLADPPFSRLDLVSCRNLFIYLDPAAQAKAISLFHFALRDRGILLLGGSETIGNAGGFKAVSLADRIYRHVALGRNDQPALSEPDLPSVPRWRGTAPSSTRQVGVAELCRRLIMEDFAPATVLINRKNECLYSLGRIDHFLKAVTGTPTQDALAMARDAVRIKLRSAIQQARQANSRIVLSGCSMQREGRKVFFSIDVRPVLNHGDEMLLVRFVDDPADVRRQPPAARDLPRVAQLEQELIATQADLEAAIRNLEISRQEQAAINDEALSANEEFQSTNEELLASKEELQSLNEELTALNGQLQETLERQRTTFNDLQNVLYSTDVATLFLDTELNIRFFTPATRSIFSVIPSDVGRPLADLNSLADDAALQTDARSVLSTGTPLDREIEARNGRWYNRRILPYHTQDGRIEGVVITFADITERHHATAALNAAKREAEIATVAKSRFLAAASHDLRQPLQTLALLQGLLADAMDGVGDRHLLARLDDTLTSMSDVLDTLLDISQIEAGIVRPDKVDFQIKGLLDRLGQEFSYHARERGIDLSIVPSDVWIHSDPRLLAQMIRNLLSNALKYTSNGRVVLGCRRRNGVLSVEIWDSGIGIRDEDINAIFDEYHQVDNPARERGRGLGLGLSIVKRLADLLSHNVRVKSRFGKGSVFAIEVPRSLRAAGLQGGDQSAGTNASDRQTGTILIVEDDSDMRSLLEVYLKREGCRVATAPNGAFALDLISSGAVRSALVLADYNLPNGMDGLELIAKMRESLRSMIPAIILTGDISVGTMHKTTQQNCLLLHKPVKPKELIHTIQRLLAASQQIPAKPHANATGTQDADDKPVVFVVDDDGGIRESVRLVLEDEGWSVETHATCEAFLDAYREGRQECLLIDAYLPGMSGLELLQKLHDEGRQLPAIMITGKSDVPMAVSAMKSGAFDFIEKPIGRLDLVSSVRRALEQAKDMSRRASERQLAAKKIANLTQRQHQIMVLILAGHPNKNIASELGISQRTVENHRASIMKKTGSRSLPALARIAIAASREDIGQAAKPNGGDVPLRG